MVKARPPDGGFLRWVRAHTPVGPRTAENYMRLHRWVASHQKTILQEKPRSLRQFYILAGILPEDGRKVLRGQQGDELARLRRFVWRTRKEAGVHLGYGQAADLWKVIQPLEVLFEEVKKQVAREAELQTRRAAMD